MKTSGKLNSTALELAALILFISLLSSTAIVAPLPNSPGIVNVKFTASSTTGYAPLTINFYDQTTFGTSGVINNRCWFFGDGTTSCGSSSLNKNPTHTYSAPGEYKVDLIEAATFPTTYPDEGYYNDSISTKVIKVLKPPVAKTPVAAFSASPTTGSIPLKVQFTDKSTNNPTSWKWDFGDGTTSTTHNPLHTYIKAGSLTVTLTATNAAGSSKVTKTAYIKVTTPKKPVAAFSASPTSGKAPLTVTFTDKSTNSPTSWAWKFGDGSTSTVHKPVHKYSKKGTYTVSLTVKNAGGSSSVTKSKYITVK